MKKNMLTCGNDNVLLIPNVLISLKDPQVPVANPSSQPRFIRKGEVLATIMDPARYFDTPCDEQQWCEMSSKAEALAAIIEATKEDNAPEAEEYGPKTAAMLDPTVYPSSQMKELLDVGSLLGRLQDEAWRMLVFESPVWSGFLMPKGFNRNRNRSAFFLEVKKPDRTAKNRTGPQKTGP